MTAVKKEQQCPLVNTCALHPHTCVPPSLLQPVFWGFSRADKEPAVCEDDQHTTTFTKHHCLLVPLSVRGNTVERTASTENSGRYRMAVTGDGTETGSAGDLVACELRHPSSSLLQASAQNFNKPTEDALQKRELRLMKNREAARECRRKKKEYVKCLENRVAMLENQNKTLIEELRALKNIYRYKVE